MEHEDDAESIHYDELPSYNPQSDRVPAYTRENDGGGEDARELDRRALVFSLRQLSRKTQKFISMGPPQFMMRNNRFTELATDITIGHHDPQSTLPYPWYNTNKEFTVEHKTSAGFSRTKPDMVVTASNREQRRASLPPLRRRSFFGTFGAKADAADEPGQLRRGSTQPTSTTMLKPNQQPLAAIRFARTGPLPWTPRARIVYAKSFVDCFGHDGHQLDEHYAQNMELHRSRSHGWAVTMIGRRYAWQLHRTPMSLVLVDLETEQHMATFIYSEFGSWARQDAEVGRLRVPLQAAPGSGSPQGTIARAGMQDGLMEFIICSLSVAIAHWRNECKILINIAQVPGDAQGETEA